MMGHYTFSQIKESVWRWSRDELPSLLSVSDSFDITKNNEELLLID